MKDGVRRRALATAAVAAALGVVLLVVQHGRSTRVEHAQAPDAAEPATTSTEMPAPLTTQAVAPAPPTPNPATFATNSAAPPASGFDEVELMRLLRSARGNDPALAVELAREGNRRFPTSPDAPERASILIHALSERGQNSEARGEAEDMVNRYPESDWVHEIERFTGAHRRRNVRVDEHGQLQFYDAPPS